MGTTPDHISADIRRTRAELSHNFDRLVDKTSPKRIAHRQGDKARRGLGRFRERVMGTMDDAKHSMSDGAGTVREQAHHAAEAAREAPQRVRAETQGSPLAAGLIAFGAGLLTAGLLPATDEERKAARQVRDKVQDSDQLESLKQQAAETAKGIGADVGETAKHAAHNVQETTAAAAREVGDKARDEGGRTADQAKSGR
ncbi:DUF3618 domain-containing protein [Actinokineospora fastidiosa]|uniref:DUF3618 domain-containing protein n=1 Tax=Actinokineospora fastidiosa TaxID=1816 RepID=A0A918LCR2_9PSEU|nr:DUF3618 domain-containing protein [Actinokineospora fastidiosa]GGS30033.1 hypothetical protein GCM10010171_24330 [Actinokineospora fastidiosa]